jgi:PleD family two-component response regulator
LDEELRSRKDVAIVYAIRALDKEQSIRSEMDPHPKKDALPKRILLVDSEEDQRLILASLLREENHQVTICGKSSEALDFFEKEEFDFVIVEHLPLVLDGLRLLEQFKQLKTKIPILVISSQYEIDPILWR